jgi:osmotically-inducible protein OsmY
MRKNHLILILLLAAATTFALAQGQGGTAGGAGGGTPPTADTQSRGDRGQDKAKADQTASVDDETLHRQVHEQLTSDPNFKNVTVDVKDGVVDLNGVVPSKEDRKRAKEMAKSIPGVKKVKEHLSVSALAAGATSGTTAGTSPSTSTSDMSASSGAQTGTSAGTAGTTTGASTDTSGAGSSGAIGAGTGTSASSGGTATEQRVVGCLQSPSAGMWVLNTKDNKQYELRGDTSKLSEHRGHTVAVYGSPESTTSSMGVGSTSGTGGTSGTASAGSSTTGAGASASGSIGSTSGTGSQVGSAGTTAPVGLTFTRIEHVADKCEPVTSGTTGGLSGSTTDSTTSSTGATGGTTGSMGSSTQDQTSGTAGATGSIGSSQGTAGTSGTMTGTTRESGSMGTMSSSGSSSDLQSQIDSALRNEPSLSSSNIRVSVTEDSIDLSGNLNSSKERETALRIVRSYAGNRKVVDHLKTSGSSSTPSGSSTNPKY